MLSKFLFRRFSQCVPSHPAPDSFALNDFKSFLDTFKKILILTGAGVSTESGIPDYRSENVGVFAKSSYKPIMYSEFLKNPDARTRYWARNFVGWPRFQNFKPNAIHFYVAYLENTEQCIGLVTQNVDGLHTKAGSKKVVELHGNAYWVNCINCGQLISRFDFQTILENCNPFMKLSENEIRPDGDVELNSEDVKNFKVPPCEKCGGILKPTVVFFGDNVPPKRIQIVEKLVEECDSVLILGTTLTTLSSFRIVNQAFDLCKFLCLINIGPSRADKLVDLKIEAKISDILPSKYDEFGQPLLKD